jgi:DNA polymerase-3 subunit chi
MPSVIYFVETTSAQKRATLCRWVERFYREGKKVQVVTDSTMAAQHVDQMLWTFSDVSFIPHAIVTHEPDGTVREAVLITTGVRRLAGYPVLVADAAVDLDFMLGFPIGVHFVLTDAPERRQESRLLWQSAKERGAHLEHVPQTAA